MATPHPAVPSFVQDELPRLGVEAAPAMLERLAVYLDQLLEANRRFNLTAVRDRETAWRRHVIDSLTLLAGLETLPAGATIIDVGSGGGLPGIPLAIARPDLRVTLLEATGKKARFLEQCVATLALGNVQVVQDRAEHAGQSAAHRGRYDVAVCRALGPMNVLAEYTLPLVKQGGRVLAMKGPTVERELDAAADALATLGAGDLAVIDAYPPGFDRHTVIVSIVKDRPTPRAYPRLPGVPKQSPL